MLQKQKTQVSKKKLSLKSTILIHYFILFVFLYFVVRLCKFFCVCPTAKNRFYTLQVIVVEKHLKDYFVTKNLLEICISVIINKALLEYKHVHLFSYYLWLLLQYICRTELDAHKYYNILYLALHLKSLITLGMNNFCSGNLSICLIINKHLSMVRNTFLQNNLTLLLKNRIWFSRPIIFTIYSCFHS